MKYVDADKNNTDDDDDTVLEAEVAGSSVQPVSLQKFMKYVTPIYDAIFTSIVALLLYQELHFFTASLRLRAKFFHVTSVLERKRQASTLMYYNTVGQVMLILRFTSNLQR